MSGQNTSSAVMAQRVEPPDSLDYFPTPPWATRALIEHVIVPRLLNKVDVDGMTAWEPACGEGHMARPLAEYFGNVHATDVHDYSATFADQEAVVDFLIPWNVPAHFVSHPPHWIISNPPFRLGAAFISRALEIATNGVAMLVRTAFLEGETRYRALFDPLPPTIVAPFVQRVPMFKGRLDGKGSTATSYCWLVWSWPAIRTNPAGLSLLKWIPPCRAKLERPGDYVNPGEAAP